MTHDRSLRAPVWKAVFEVFAVSLIPAIVANRAEPKYVPWWLALACLVVALSALAMWMHDAGYSTVVSSRIDAQRQRRIDTAARIAEGTRLSLAAEHERLRLAEQNVSSMLWTSGHSYALVGDSWCVALSLNGPTGFDPMDAIGWEATCHVTHEGTTYVAHGSYGQLWLDLAFPQDFEPIIDHPLPIGQYEVDWEPDFPAFAARDRFIIDLNGRLLTRTRNS